LNIGNSTANSIINTTSHYVYANATNYVAINSTAISTGNSTVNTTITATSVNAASHTVGTSFVANSTYLIIGGNTTPSNTLTVTGGASFSNKINIGLAAGYDFANLAQIEIDSSQNTYSQIVIQNANSGVTASGDLVVTADTGNDSYGYVDLGINSSGYSNGLYTIVGALDSYLYASNGNLGIGTASAKDLIFHTNGTLATNERVRIASNATIVIANGTALIANGTAGTSGQVLTSNGVGLYWATASGGGSTLTANSTDTQTFYLPMSNTSSGSWSNAVVSTTKLYFVPSTGTLNATIFNSLSDANVKENVQSIPSALDIVRSLDGVSFNWKDNGDKSYGVIAQEVEKIIPELVSDTDPKSVNYSGIIAFLINAVKELDAEIRSNKCSCSCNK
jgi:hypothetical protein